MFYQIKGVLTPAEIEHLRKLATEVRFVDGRATNRGSRVKNNLQVPQNDPHSAEPGQVVRNAIFRNAEIRAMTFPKTLARPTLSRYEPGMHYGRHVDESLFPSTPNPMRSDVSCTVFISDPADYDGGELEIEVGSGTVAFKLEPGAAVIYPSTTIHQVRPVARGERLVAVAWIHSYIADAAKRQILYQINQLIASRSGEGDAAARVQMEAIKNNLFRMWAEV